MERGFSGTPNFNFTSAQVIVLQPKGVDEHRGHLVENSLTGKKSHCFFMGI